ncbi:MAG: iron-regulated protein [Chloroflexota bacterium]|nr:iron-regulated protein [Chloroflexota bacterium]
MAVLAKRLLITISVTLLALAAMAACTSQGPTDELKTSVVENYAAGAYASYARSLASAQAMDVAIDNFIAEPSQVRLDAAKRAWLLARDDYGVTEIYRFYEGPIDNEENGPEGLINAWPMDESYVDYVEGNADAGIINMPDEYPTIDADLLVSLNEEGGEENISTGWHAIEFLLWGQDLNEDGPGYRPVSDYTTADNADRRATYLAVTSDLLLSHLQDMVDAWAPGQSNYRAQFLAKDSDAAITDIVTGIGEMSRGELAGERMTVAYDARSQEDEHSCFSDNTISDIVANAAGIQRVYFGEYGSVSGAGIRDLIAAQDQALADKLAAEINRSVYLARSIPAPFDGALLEGISDAAPNRRAVLDTIEALEAQTDTIVSAAQEVGITISVS